MKRLYGKLIAGLILGVVVAVALTLYADVRKVGVLLQGFQWRLVPLILALTAVNYALRFVKWHYYLRQIGVHNLPAWDNLLIFMGGFGFSLTPGKTGELVKTVWLQTRTGVHPARTSPMVFAERLSDGIAMALLALGSGLLYPQYRPVLLTIGLVLVVMVAVIEARPLARWVLALGERAPLISRIAHHLHALYESAYELLRPRNLGVAVGLGMLAWLVEGVAFLLILTGLGLPASSSLLVLAIFILSFALIAGGASGMPGGLGVTEGGLAGMLILLAAVPEATASVATLLIRFCVLWFGVIVGLSIVLVRHHFLFGYKHKGEPLTAPLEAAES